MNRYVVSVLIGAGLAAGLSLAGCAVDSSEPSFGSISVDLQEMKVHGTCPVGWMGSQYLKVYCPDDMVLVSQTFGRASCVRCAEPDVPEPPGYCAGSWRHAELMFGCIPGFVLEYSEDGQCKRCVAADDELGGEDDEGDECESHDDCFRTGCSGEICAAESTMSLCIWRPEHACYQDKFCGCRQGRCGFKNHPKLLQCIEDARNGN